MSKHKYGSNVPLARQELGLVIALLREKGDNHHAFMLESILYLMHRKPVVRHTPVRHHPPTREQRAAVWHLSVTTDMSQQAIAEALGMNAGRVSEILNGN